MAMVRVAPVTVQVRTDWVNGIPREITWGEDRLPVTRLVSVRDEGRPTRPSPGRARCSRSTRRSLRLALTYQHRSRRWTIEGLDGLAAAA